MTICTLQYIRASGTSVTSLGCSYFIIKAWNFMAIMSMKIFAGIH